MRFKGHTKEHTVTAQVIDRSRMTPILGMDFWKPHMAVFNTKENVIPKETEEADGSIIVEHIDCWSEERSRKTKTVASLQDQLVDIQKASTWAQQETSTVYTVQAGDIASTTGSVPTDTSQRSRAANVTASEHNVQINRRHCDSSRSQADESGDSYSR